MEIHSGDEPSWMNDSSSDINGESMGSMGGDNIGGELGNVDACWNRTGNTLGESENMKGESSALGNIGGESDSVDANISGKSTGSMGGDNIDSESGSEDANISCKSRDSMGGDNGENSIASYNNRMGV